MAERPDPGHRHYPTPTTTARWVPAVLAPILLALAVLAIVGPASLDVAVPAVLTSAVAWGAILVLVMLGAVGVSLALRSARRQTGRAFWLSVAVVAVFTLLTALAGRIPRMAFFADFGSNWQGKVIDLLWVGLLFAMLWRWARRDAGVRWRLREGSLRPAIITIGAVFVLFTVLGLVAALTDSVDPASIDAEQILYDTTIPNLTEELIWRAAMLAVLDRAYGTPWRIAGAQVGWGLVITTVGFGAGHMILLDPAGTLSLSIGGGVFASVMGLALGWIWARTGSVWPAFALHCAPEFGRDIGVLLVA